MKDENVEDMDESELRKELKKLYKKINDLSDNDMEELSFDAKMKMKKKNADGEVVETREKAI